jgi:hypothetical protein
LRRFFDVHGCILLPDARVPCTTCMQFHRGPSAQPRSTRNRLQGRINTNDDGVRTRTAHRPTVTREHLRELERARAPTDLTTELASAMSRAFPGAQPAGARTRSSNAPAERPDPPDGAHRCQYVARPPLMS